MKILLTLSPGLEPDNHRHLVVVDWETQSIVDSATLPFDFFESSHKGFAGGVIHGDRLFVVDEVQLFEFSLNPIKLVRKATFPILNDAHHIEVTGERFFVANSGLETVEEFDLDFRHIQSHFLLQKNGRSFSQLSAMVWKSMRKAYSRFIGRNKLYTHLGNRPPLPNLQKVFNPRVNHVPARDVRSIDFRPHVLHPNHVWSYREKIYVTLSVLGKIVELETGNLVLDNLGFPHDGAAFHDQFFVTDCSRNELVVTDFSRETGRISRDSRRIKTTQSIQEGFLRGVTCNESQIFVGFSARRGVKEFSTARVRAIDRRTFELQNEFTVPTELGRGVFSLIDVSRIYEQ